jgi:hypothetical protein
MPGRSAAANCVSSVMVQFGCAFTVSSTKVFCRPFAPDEICPFRAARLVAGGSDNRGRRVNRPGCTTLSAAEFFRRCIWFWSQRASVETVLPAFSSILSNAASGIKMRFPILIVGSWPVRAAAYAALRDIPRRCAPSGIVIVTFEFSMSVSPACAPSLSVPD